jgi:hypothetical protein
MPSVVLYLGATAMAIKVMETEINLEAKKSMTMAICPWNTTMFGLNAFQNILTSGQCDPLLYSGQPLIRSSIRNVGLAVLAHRETD